MLLFLDESYEEDGTGRFRYAYAGFAIDERKYRGLAVVFQSKMRFFVQDSGFSDEERREVRKTRIISGDPPERAEMKASKMLTAKQAEYYALHGKAPGMELCLELMDALHSSQATVFGVLSNPAHPDEIQKPAVHLPLQYVRLFERVEQWMREQHSEEMVIVVPDTIHNGVNQNLSERIADFLFRSEAGRKMRHLVINPFWVDSCTTAGSQLADIIAHFLMNSMRPTATRKRLDVLWRKVVALEFRSNDLETRGIRRLRK